MRHPLDGVYAKIRRAKEHLGNLETDITRRRQAQEYGLRLHINPQTGEQHVYAFVPYELRIDWGLRAGDIVHNLRAALDHLVYQLVIANGQTPSTQNEFPIYSSLGEYQKQNGLRKLAGVRKGAVAIIEGLQPENADDSLWVLRCLDNEDKHNLVNVAALVADLRQVGIGGTGYIENIHIRTTRASLDSIEDGADLYSRIADPGVEVHTRPEVEVTFAESGPGRGKEVVPLLAQLVEYVEVGVIPLFGLAKRKPIKPKWVPPGERGH
jgi:hypothetical protein